VSLRRPLKSIAASVALALVGTLAFVPAGGCSGKSEATPGVVKCTPGNYVFCRCQNREEGTKLCNEDGASFAKCEPCETFDNPAIPDDPDVPPVVVDGGGGRVDSGTLPGNAVCGDKIVQDGEDCDDGNKVDDDGCDSGCHLAGTNPAATRACPGLDTHVWSKPVVYVGTTVGAPAPGQLKNNCTSTTGGNPTSAANGPERIFNVTAHKTGKMTVATSDTNYDSLVYVAKPCSTASIEYLACANNTNGVGGETMSFPVTAGQSYSVFVDGAGITLPSGAFRITFSIP
jgi:cysteine-rich repeat protein